MSRMITAASGHSMCVSVVKRENLPSTLAKETSEYERFWAVQNWEEGGHVFFYLGKGHKLAPQQVCGFWPKGGFWNSYGDTFKTAIDGMQKDGWLSA